MKTYEVYSSGGQLLVEFAANSKHSEHVYLGTKRVGSWDKVTSSGSTTTTQSLFHLDPAGTPLLATSSTGTVLWKENHRPYGDKLNYAPAASGNTIGYAGKPYDNATGLSYMGARYYHPALGRFMAMDPVGFQEGNIHSHNRYTYANNNPYKFVDPDGREAAETNSDGKEGLSFQGAAQLGGTKNAVEALGRGITTAVHNALSNYANIALTALTVSPLGKSAGLGLKGAGGMANSAQGAKLAADLAKQESAALGATFHGSGRIAGPAASRGGVLSAEQIAAVRGSGQHLTQTDGAKVSYTQTEAGKFNVAIDGKNGLITSFENLSQKSFDKLGSNYGWK